jgi:GT2 family glycosyltransferase
MKITILIPIYNRLHITKVGLKELFRAFDYYNINSSKVLNIDVIIIDDASTDGSAEWIKQNYPAITILKGDGNLWWSGAINLGARYAVEQKGSDFVMLWNDDITCAPEYFTELEKVLQTDEKYRSSILVSKIYWLEEPDRLFNLGCYYNKKTGKKTVVGFNEQDSPEFNKILPVDWSGGMGTLIPVAILTAVNYFNNVDFPQYHGDSDFFLRAKKIGYKAYAIPTLKIWNKRDSTGINEVEKVQDVKKFLFSNRSNYNLKQNMMFVRTHSNTFLSWLNLIYIYVKFFVKAAKNILFG